MKLIFLPSFQLAFAKRVELRMRVLKQNTCHCLPMLTVLQVGRAVAVTYVDNLGVTQEKYREG